MSEFGSGLVICLTKFAEHVERDDLRKLSDSKDVRAVNSAILLWVNGASDHLYEIRVPGKWRRRKIARMVRDFKVLGLEMGHGDRTNWRLDEWQGLCQMAREIALEIDKQIGITDGDEGEY